MLTHGAAVLSPKFLIKTGIHIDLLIRKEAGLEWFGHVYDLLTIRILKHKLPFLHDLQTMVLEFDAQDRNECFPAADKFEVEGSKEATGVEEVHGLLAFDLWRY